MKRLINIESAPSLENILTGDLIGEFRKTIIEVMRRTSGSATDDITRRLVLYLSILEDAREEYYDAIEKGGVI